MAVSIPIPEFVLPLNPKEDFPPFKVSIILSEFTGKLDLKNIKVTIHYHDLKAKHEFISGDVRQVDYVTSGIRLVELQYPVKYADSTWSVMLLIKSLKTKTCHHLKEIVVTLPSVV